MFVLLVKGSREWILLRCFKRTILPHQLNTHRKNSSFITLTYFPFQKHQEEKHGKPSDLGNEKVKNEARKTKDRRNYQYGDIGKGQKISTQPRITYTFGVHPKNSTKE